MKRLIVNILLLIVATFLFCTVGLYGLIYSLITSIFKYNKISFLTYWSHLIYSVNVGIDQIGNVLLAAFLNRYAIFKLDTPFGEEDEAISYVLAMNYFTSNLRPFGKFLVNTLEKLDRDHMTKSLKRNN